MRKQEIEGMMHSRFALSLNDSQTPKERHFCLSRNKLSTASILLTQVVPLHSDREGGISSALPPTPTAD